MAMDGIMACGMVVLLVSGMFDLSVGSMLSMAGVLTGWLLTQGHVPAPLAICLGLGIGAWAAPSTVGSSPRSGSTP